MTTALPAVAHRESFERNVIAASAAGAAAGLAHLMLTQVLRFFGFGFDPFPAHELFQPVSLSLMAILAATLATTAGVAHRWRWRALAMLPVIPYVFDAQGIWKPLFAGAIAGAFMVRVRRDAPPAGSGAPAPGWANAAIGALVTAVFAAGGVAVARILGDVLAGSGAPAWLSCALAAATVALFVALGSIAGHVGLKGNAAQSRLGAAAESARDPEVQKLLQRASMALTGCLEVLEPVAKNPARDELLETLDLLANGAAERAEGFGSITAQLEAGQPAELDAEIERLGTRARSVQDTVARRQLEVAGEALRLERSRVNELAGRRERLLAQLEAEVALLGSARMSLVQARSANATISAADLLPISQRIASLRKLDGTENSIHLVHAERSESAAPVRTSGEL